MLRRKRGALIYCAGFGTALLWYFAMPPSNERDWHPEVEKVLDYERQGDMVRVENIRNFHWRSVHDYDVAWETREYDLSKLESYDLILSDWGLGKIVHTMASFGFSDGRRISFSIEIRKERHERFSAVGGFFRQFELGLVAGDESDLIYTRTNHRGEDVYIYPVKMSKESVKALFLSYLDKGRSLNREARWYNTLMSNCTTLIFDMMNQIESIPLDYRGVLTGGLPEYLYDKKVLSHQYTLEEWKRKAHANPKVVDFRIMEDQSDIHFSRLLRQGIQN